MSILIKVMEMPKSCGACELFGEYGCPFIGAVGYALTEGKRNEDCPLVPVPQHGRCIDAEALWGEINKICDRRDAGIISDLTCLQQILSVVRHAPTIIPTEGDDAE